jgi:hypothetical protein
MDYDNLFSLRETPDPDWALSIPHMKLQKIRSALERVELLQLLPDFDLELFSGGGRRFQGPERHSEEYEE